MKFINSLLIVLITVLLFSCNLNNTDSKKEHLLEKAPMINKKTKRITPAPTTLPSYMGFILQNLSRFDITKEQKEKLIALKIEFQAKASPLKEKILQIDKDIRMMAMDSKFSAKEIKSKSKESHDTRIAFAEVKTACRDSILKVVSNEQWDEIVAYHKVEKPYKDDNFLLRITTFPTFMLDVYHVENINLSKEKEDVLLKWNEKDHYGAMMMQTDIMQFEKEAIEMSYNKGNINDILNIVKKCENTRHKFISEKTKCRDYMLEKVLTQKQWDMMMVTLK